MTVLFSSQAWRWSSLWRYYCGGRESRALLARCPLARPRGWQEHVKTPMTDAELAAVRRAVQRNSPFGAPDWQRRTAQRLDLEATLRPRGRPRIPR